MNLSQWLEYLEALHPQEIDLGLDRIRQVAARLPLDFSGKRVITVGGTNGKGTTLAMLDGILRAAGQRTAVYTSPHLLHYNERVRLDGRLASDDALCEAFTLVEAARQDITLTYFEFGTLAAFVLFAQEPVDWVLLEVGLGGRLDAVNLIDANASILTNVALDHMDWLGDTREAIGQEKAGIFRAGRPAIYGERDMPETVGRCAATLGAHLLRQAEDFGWQQQADGRWHWWGLDSEGQALAFQDLPAIAFPLDNAACALQALCQLLPGLSESAIHQGLKWAHIAGRFQQFELGHTLILDVAHNPHAAHNLARNLAARFPGRPLHMVIAMLGDKDSAGVIAALKGDVCRWYVGQIQQGSRSVPAKMLYNQLLEAGQEQVSCHASVLEAYQAATQACSDQPGSLVVVTGSFFTVTAVLEWLAGQGHTVL